LPFCCFIGIWVFMLWFISNIINLIEIFYTTWLKIRTIHPRTKTTKTIRTVSRNLEDKNTPLSKESTKSSSETEEEQSEMTLTSPDPNLFKKELKHSKPGQLDTLSLFKYKHSSIFKSETKFIENGGILCKNPLWNNYF